MNIAMGVPFSGYTVETYLYLKAKDDSPDEAENESRVAVHYVLSANVLKVHLEGRVQESAWDR